MAEYELAHRGVDVLLLEKERLPRYKTCAGGIPLKTVQLLDLDLSSACEMTVTKGSCTYRGTSPVLMDFGEVVGCTVMREKFDYLILKGAMEAGPRVTDGQGVRELRRTPIGCR
jgi:flavin-dependent dehydrogenase